MERGPQPSAAIDALKAIASQLIVLHHLAAYGPVARAMHAGAPALVDWLYDYARMAVQVFLVVGGYLAAQALAARPRAVQRFPLRAIVARYLRLALPYLAALALAIAAAAIARVWVGEEFVPGAPGAGQLLAHALLLTQVLGYDALSAGIWYVAIDFQLFALFVVMLWAGRRASVLLVAALGAASLFLFNRDPSLDNWAIYFFGAYAMGVTVRWAQDARRPALWIAGIVAVAVAALAVDFRWRIVVALATALALAASRLHTAAPPLLPPVLGAAMRGLSRISYALFLVHFPVILVACAVFEALGARGPVAGFAAALSVWIASLLLAGALHRWVEAPAIAFSRFR